MTPSAFHVPPTDDAMTARGRSHSTWAGVPRKSARFSWVGVAYATNWLSGDQNGAEDASSVPGSGWAASASNALIHNARRPSDAPTKTSHLPSGDMLNSARPVVLLAPATCSAKGMMNRTAG